MQQLKQRQNFTVQTARSSGTQAQKSPTKIETISTAGNIKVALKSKVDNDIVQSAANMHQPASASASETAPLADPDTTSLMQHGAGGDFGGGQQAWAAGLLSDDRFAKPLMAAAAVAGLLILGATTLALLPNSETDMAPAQAIEDATPAAPSDNLTRLMQVAAVDTPTPASGVNAPVVSGTALAAAEGDTGGDIMSRMAAGTLAALRSPTPAPVAVPAVADGQGDIAQPSLSGRSELYQLVMTAHAQGQSPSYIDQLLNDAYLRGQISVPQGLLKTDGRVDTATILSLFIQ